MLEEKVAIITGGTRGIGFATAQKFKENKAKVIIFGSKKETVDKAKANLEVEGYYPNLNDYEEVVKTIKEIKTKYGHIDILVNNAGMSANQKIEDTSISDFDKIIDLNVRSMFYVTKAVVEIMQEQKAGVILNTSSMVSIYGQPSGVGYPMSKSGVNGFTKSLARELGPYNIRVNAVAPGIIQTDMVAKLPKEMIDPLIKSIPLRRIGQPEDIANAFVFLASDMASYITGSVLSVDGAAQN